MDEQENLLDQFYAPNEGDPLRVAQRALIRLREGYRAAGAKLEIIAAGTTGYGELLFAKAFGARCHVVETVAHARAVEKYVSDASFILDIGGQDMKAIWIDKGIITNIVVNEACSSGCGSFLENFAASLHVPVEKLAQTAFSANDPANLGSRCTVFMNSSIVTEQRNGKLPADIVAGLCRAVIENVFTKVIRMSNVDSLGKKIVVQGGTFRNDAVLRAMEQYIGREEAIRLGKQYVHNDICFPAQIVIGEALAALRSGKYNGQQTAVCMAKYVGDCRLTHYSPLLRKALDDAGYPDIPILTNDDVDSHDMHPGFKMNHFSAARVAFALPMIDALEELLRKMRPYELEPGSTERAFEQAMDHVVEGLSGGLQGIRGAFRKAIDCMCRVKYDRSKPRPGVLIVGEYLLNFHPGANHDIELYLEKNGFEIIEARMADVIQKSYFYQGAQIREYGLKRPLGKKAWFQIVDQMFDWAHELTDSIAKAHPLYERAVRLPELVVDSDPIIHHTFDAGEGVLISGEILHHAKHGCRAFVILQPFGCLPNHVVGRGVAKQLKKLYPDAQILPLDYDPDVSFANIENRLQMLVMNARQEQERIVRVKTGVALA